jgi:antagonist of KipI
MNALTVQNPGLYALIVDLGRFGYAAAGVPASSGLDAYACRALYHLTGNADTPVIEAIGPGFALHFDADVTFAITGARVKAFLDESFVRPWTAFRAKRGSVLRVREVMEGLRYYIGFSGKLGMTRVMGSYATNLECGFGGVNGRPLKAGDTIDFDEVFETDAKMIPGSLIPSMHPPHKLRVLEGPEAGYFTEESRRLFWEKGAQSLFTVSALSNRTGIRLEGTPLLFGGDVPKSIVSEGIVAGTVQVPGDGLPIIMLHERTIGGYARAAVIAGADLDRLAHLSAGEFVIFEKIGREEAEALWREKQSCLASFGPVHSS